MEKYRYPMLLLDVLGVTESELAAAEGPSGFFARRLRVMVLQSLSQADEIMTLQGDVCDGEDSHAASHGAAAAVRRVLREAGLPAEGDALHGQGGDGDVC